MKQYLFIFTAILLSSPCLAQIQERIDRWDSLCMTHPPYKDNDIDSNQIDFYRSLYETLDNNERKIPLNRHDSLMFYAKRWQWSDSAFLKNLRCLACIQALFYDFSVQKSTGEIIKRYESLKDTVQVTFMRSYSDYYPQEDIEIPFDSSKAKIYCLYYPSDSKFTNDFQKSLQTVEWQGWEQAKLVKNGFVHPGQREGNHSLIILKYANIYYQLGAIRPGSDITLIVMNALPRATLKVEPAKIYIIYDKWMPRVLCFNDSYDKLKRYSKRNHQILRSAKKQTKKKRNRKN